MRHELAGELELEAIANRWKGSSKVENDLADGPPELNHARGLIPSLAEFVMSRYSFARHIGSELYLYEHSCYQRENAEQEIRCAVREALDQRKLIQKWKPATGFGVIQYIRDSRIPDLWEAPPLDRINLANGILDVSTGKLEEHSRDFLSPICLPVRYDPSAECRAWERFVSEVLGSELSCLAWEIAAWLITPDVSQQKAVLLLGPGGNGKSVFIDGMTALLGRRNISTRTLHSLEDDRFATADLVGKLANICGDLPQEVLRSTDVFKALTSPDRITAQRKHRPAFEFTPFARLLFSANSMPRSADSSDGFFRRWLVIPFNRSFEGSPDRRSRQDLDRELQSPEELSGLLNRALEVLPRFRQLGFSEPEPVRRAGDEFREATDPLAVWLNRRTRRTSNGRVPCKALLLAFNEEVHKPADRGYLSMNALTKAMKRLGIERKESEDRYYAGIELVNERE